MRPPPVVLSIAGSDSGAGAGIQADLKAIHANGGYATTAITAVTAQNTRGVRGAWDLPPDAIVAQIDAVLDDFDVRAIKTGMLSNAATIDVVASRIASAACPVVVDPVMIAKGGHALLAADAVEALRDRLLRHATVVTPNRHEAERLTGRSIERVDDAIDAGRALVARGAAAAVVKGGHLPSAPATDVVVTANDVTVLDGTWIDSTATHGTGCTFAAALATRLAAGDDVVDAARAAKAFVTGAIRSGHALGGGHNPTDAFWRGTARS